MSGTETMRRAARSTDPVTAVMRPPQQVMLLPRIGAFHQTRLSFVRTLVRRMGREAWQFALARKELDADGFGTVVYRIATPAGVLSFVAFSSPLAAEERTDRVIAEKWDTAFALVAGEADDGTIDRLRRPDSRSPRFTP